MAVLPDPAGSQALLVGVAGYTSLQPLPAVENNLTSLKAALNDPLIWGLPLHNCTVLRQPDSIDTVLNSLQRAASAATDTLLVYFAGHGLIDQGNEDELYLALPGSDRERAYRTAVPYGWVRREMLATRIRRKIVILDCCYSGRALTRMGGDQVNLTDRLEIEGTCVLTATPRTSRALAPPNERFTAFTGELMTVLERGIPGGPELLDMDTIFRRLTVKLKARGLPLPQRGQLDHGGDIAIARNRALPTRPSYQSDSPSREPHEGTNRTAEAREQAKPWHDALVDGRTPTVEGLTTPSNISTAGGVVLVGASVVWVTLAALLAYFANQHGWLLSAAACGFLSLLIVGQDVEFQWVGSLLGIVTFSIYVVAPWDFANSWLVRGCTIGILILFVPIIFGRWGRMLKVWSANNEALELKSQQRIVDAVKSGRWLAVGNLHRPELAALLNQLSEIPAARFAGIRQGRFPYAVIAGNRVLLVGFVAWPPGEYTRTGDAAYDIRRNGELLLAESDELAKTVSEAAEWRSALSRSVVRVVVVVRPTYSPADIVLRLGEVEDNITFATLETFTDVVGPFLIEGAYEFNVPAMGELLSRLDPRTYPVI